MSSIILSSRSSRQRTSRVNLLDLPSEVRMIIFTHLGSITRLRFGSLAPAYAPPIFLVSRKIYEESREAFYFTAVIAIESIHFCYTSDQPIDPDHSALEERTPTRKDRIKQSLKNSKAVGFLFQSWNVEKQARFPMVYSYYKLWTGPGWDQLSRALRHFRYFEIDQFWWSYARHPGERPGVEMSMEKMKMIARDTAFPFKTWISLYLGRITSNPKSLEWSFGAESEHACNFISYALGRVWYTQPHVRVLDRLNFDAVVEIESTIADATLEKVRERQARGLYGLPIRLRWISV